MLGTFTKKTEDLEAYRDITDDVIESDFVPYAGLYNPNTILTKNGEVLQIIKIVGFSYEAIAHEKAELRDTIRQAIMSTIPNDEYAIWFHTLRRKTPLRLHADFPDAFSQALDDVWNDINSWDHTFVNELYITLVRQGEGPELGKMKDILKGTIPGRELKRRNAYIDRVAEELEQTGSAMLSSLSRYGARRLGLVERDGIFYSEMLEFLEKLTNLEERPMPVTEVDLSEYLTSGEITFGYNAMEVRTFEGKRRFAAVMSVKEYKEASLRAIDQFLQLPCEFIVTQCFDFINAKQALESFEEQKKCFDISGETDLADASELTRILNSNRDRAIDYGEQQTSLFVIAESVEALEKTVLTVREGLSAMGVIAIREDLKFEECYWSQLPANFEFLSRLQFTDTQHVAGFVNLNNYPAGARQGTQWGAPISLFHTAAGTPYFFNFHYGTNGHTSFLGPYGSGKSVLINFLLSQSRKTNSNIIYLDASSHAEKFITALGGNYHGPGARPFALNPFAMEDTLANRDFLGLWLALLMDPTGAHETASYKPFFMEIIGQWYALPLGERSAQKCFAMMAQAQEAIGTHLLHCWQHAIKSGWFDEQAIALPPRNAIMGFDIGALMPSPEMTNLVSSYLLHHIGAMLDKTPTIIVLDEGFTLLNNPIFQGRAGGWLDYVADQNALAIIASEHSEHSAALPVTATVMQKIYTQFYLPHDFPGLEYQEVFGLNENECEQIAQMYRPMRPFLLKRGHESIIASMNLMGYDDLLNTLSGAQSTPEDEQEGLHITAADALIASDASLDVTTEDTNAMLPTPHPTDEAL